MNTQKLTLEYMRSEIHAFRQILTTKGNSVEKIQRAFEALTFTYFQSVATGSEERMVMTDEEKDKVSHWFDCIQTEYQMRLPYLNWQEATQIYSCSIPGCTK